MNESPGLLQVQTSFGPTQLPGPGPASREVLGVPSYGLAPLLIGSGSPPNPVADTHTHRRPAARLHASRMLPRPAVACRPTAAATPHSVASNTTMPCIRRSFTLSAATTDAPRQMFQQRSHQSQRCPLSSPMQHCLQTTEPSICSQVCIAGASFSQSTQGLDEPDLCSSDEPAAFLRWLRMLGAGPALRMASQLMPNHLRFPIGEDP